MKVAIYLVFGIGVALSEPPVPSNRYLPGTNVSPYQQYVLSSDGNPSFGNNVNKFQVQRPTTKYGAPSSRNYLPPTNQPFQSDLSEMHGAPSFDNDAIITQNAQFAPAPVTKYGVPSTRNYLPPVNHQSLQTLSEIRGTTSFGNGVSTPSAQYGVPVPVAKYGVPSTRHYLSPINNQQSLTKIGVTTSFGNAAVITPNVQYDVPQSVASSQYLPPANHQYFSSSPSTSNVITPNLQYGVPSTRTVLPSPTYGTPSFNNGVVVTSKFSESAPSLKSYLPPNSGYLRSMENDGASEPANYEFKYDVQDGGNENGHEEERRGDEAQGKYYVQLPDGRRQTVEYTADNDGFKPKISYEETGNGHSDRFGGYTQGGIANDGYQY